MFDLEERIQSWRESLSSALGDRLDVVDELEAHLRDDVEQHVRAGRTAEQAFDAAVTGLGDPNTLAAEFRRAGGPTWLPARVAVALLVSVSVLLAVFIATRLVRGRIDPLLAGHVFAINVGYLATFSAGFLAVSAVFARSTGAFGARQADAFRRAGASICAVALAATLVGVLLSAAWSLLNRGVIWNWDAREVGGLCVAAWSALSLSCFRQRGIDTTFAMLAGVIGNVLVALAWFGPWVLELRPATILPTWPAQLLCAFVISQFAVAYAGMLPPGWLRRPRLRSDRAV